jgi:hypothetical protein
MKTFCRNLAVAVGLVCAVFAFTNPSIKTFAQNVANYMDQGGAFWHVGGQLQVESGGSMNIASGGAIKIGGVDLTASIASKNNDAARYVAGGSTKTLTAANNNQTIKLDTATGTAVTLPPATGTGARFSFLVTVLATSNSHVISAAGTDVMIGIIFGERVDSGNATLGFAAQSTSNTITLNRTTTGSVSKGEWVEVEDVASGIWEVKGFLTSTGAAFATPFSHV